MAHCKHGPLCPQDQEWGTLTAMGRGNRAEQGTPSQVNHGAHVGPHL